MVLFLLLVQCRQRLDPIKSVLTRLKVPLDLFNVRQSAFLNEIRSLKCRSWTQSKVVQSEPHVGLSYLLVFEVLLRFHKDLSLLLLPFLELVRIHFVRALVGKLKHFLFVLLEDRSQSVVLVPLIYFV